MNAGYTYTIEQDQDAESPRTTFDTLGTMLYCSSRYTLGDKVVSREWLQKFCDPSYRDEDDSEEAWDAGWIWLPVFAYIHSGVCLSTSSFSCQWDSGQCGIIRVSEEDVKREWKVSEISSELRETVLSVLRAEVEEYSAFLEGRVYGYVIRNAAGGFVDSCWGYYGDSKTCEEDAVEALKRYNVQVPLSFGEVTL